MSAGREEVLGVVATGLGSEGRCDSELQGRVVPAGRAWGGGHCRCPIDE